MFFFVSYGASQQRPCVRIGLTHAYLSHVKMTLANAKSVNRQTLENVVRNAASEFTRRTAIASLASLREGPPPPPPLGPLPPHQTGPPRPGLPEHCKKSQGGWGEEGRERAGREWLWLEGRVLQLQWGMGGGPSKHQLGPDPHLGTPIYDTFPPVCSLPVTFLRRNGHRPGESHFLRPPKLGFGGHTL